MGRRFRVHIPKPCIPYFLEMQSVEKSILIVAVAALLTACGGKDSKGANGANGSLPSAPETANGSEAPSAVGIETAPGLENMELFSLLADSYERIDPAQDGWQTEAFSEAANRQLQRLVALFEGSEIDMSQSLASPEFASASLVPAEYATVFTDGTMEVKRASKLSDMPVHEGPDGLRAAVKELSASLGAAAEHPHLKLKLFKVNDNQTEVLVQATAELPEGRTQIDATWICEWSMTVETNEPVLSGIDVLRHSETSYRGNASALFQDCTESVLGKTQSYREQLLHSTDYWRLRLQRGLGLDVVANHGLAVGDVNGDLLDDLYVCQQGGLPNRLYVQQSDGTLKDMTDASGTGWLDYCPSALFVDFDNDGDRDLAVGQESRLLLMENDGRGRFQLSFGISTRAQTFSIAAADYDGDGDVDIFACGYNEFGDSVRRGVMGEPMPYHDAQNGGPNILLRNDGGWEFNDATAEAGLEHNNNRFAFAAAFEDFDNDGDLDLYVANDYGRNNLYRQDDGKFRDVAAELGVEDMSSGMSVSWGDVNQDGWMDLYVSNMFSAAGNRITYQRQFQTDVSEQERQVFQRHARGNSLFQSDAKGGFLDKSVDAGVTMGRWAWSSNFVDFNNDGWEDIAIANGFISTADSGDL